MEDKEKLKKALFLLCDIEDEIDLNDEEKELYALAIKCISDKIYDS